jgi:hypothetical protein
VLINGRLTAQPGLEAFRFARKDERIQNVSQTWLLRRMAPMGHYCVLLNVITVITVSQLCGWKPEGSL